MVAIAETWHMVQVRSWRFTLRTMAVAAGGAPPLQSRATLPVDYYKYCYPPAPHLARDYESCAGCVLQKENKTQSNWSSLVWSGLFPSNQPLERIVVENKYMTRGIIEHTSSMRCVLFGAVAKKMHP